MPFTYTPLEEGIQIAIVGHSSEGKGALSLPREIELWGVNDPTEDVHLFQRWFQLHSFPYLKEHWPLWEMHSKLYWQRYWRGGGECPLYIQEPTADLIGSVRFPKEDIEQSFPFGYYHCSSFDWLVAFALLHKPKAIHLYGVELSYNGEPLAAKACLEYWLGIAVGQGVEVHTNSKDLFHAYQIIRSKRQYAWDESRPLLDLDE